MKKRKWTKAQKAQLSNKLRERWAQRKNEPKSEPLYYRRQNDGKLIPMTPRQVGAMIVQFVRRQERP
jgi:hypothetical protein